MKKKPYHCPVAEKLAFDYTEMVVASNIDDNLEYHGDQGIGVGLGGGCDHDPGHGDPHKPHPVFPNGK